MMHVNMIKCFGLMLLLFIASCNTASASMEMGAEGVVDIFLPDSLGGWGCLDWHQYDYAGNYLGYQRILVAPTDDVASINSVKAYDFNGSTVKMAYLLSNAGWSDLRMQMFNSDGSKDGSFTILESDSQDGYRKYYSGLTAYRNSGNVEMALTGLNASGQSTIFISQYSGTTRISQIEIKNYASDIGLQGVTVTDLDNDGNLDVLVGRTEDTVGIVSRLEFDSSWNLLSEDDQFITLGLWADVTIRGLEVADTNGDGELELLIAGGQPSYAGNSAVWKFSPDGSGGYVADGTEIGLTNTYYWQGVSGLSMIPEPLTLGMILTGSGALLIKRRKV